MRSLVVSGVGLVLVLSSIVGACSGKSDSSGGGEDDAGAGGSGASGGSGGTSTGGSSAGGASGSSAGGASGSSTGGASGSSTGGAGGSSAGGASGSGGDSGGMSGVGGEGGEPMCSDAPVGMLCVRGASGNEGESLAVGAPLRVELRPTGCFSSSCTEQVVAECSVTGSGSELTVTGEFCLANTGEPGVGCTADCGGGGVATCEAAESLEAGDYTVTLGDLSVSFTVPGVLPFGGTCDGSQF